MMSLVLAAALLALPITVALQDPKPCDLLSASEITAAVGARPSGRGQASGPETDREHNTRSWTCVTEVGSFMLIVEVEEYASVAAATRAMDEALRESGKEERMALAQVPGVGDQALWGSGGEGALWLARKGARLLKLLRSGENVAAGPLREPLRKLVVVALGRLS